MELYFVTSNTNKVREAERILKVKLKHISLDIEEIQTIHVEEVVKNKAHKAFDAVKKPVFVEDTGLYIKAWNGFPGALIKWLLKCLGNEGICKILGDYDRTAVVRTCIGIYDGKTHQVFTGEVKGRIVKKPRGETNFGWDPIFMPDGYEKTYAELPPHIKDKISMRNLAFEKMKEFLDKGELSQ